MIAPRTKEEITSDWVQHVLDQTDDSWELSSFEIDRDFNPVSLIADVCRITLKYSGAIRGPSSLILKIPTTKSNRQGLLTNRIYEKEGRVYRLLAENERLAVPKFFGAFNGVEDGEVVLVLEDMSPAIPGSQLAGCSVDDARDVLIQIADIHANFWEDQRLPKRNPVRMAEVYSKFIETGWNELLSRHGNDLQGVRSTYDWFRENMRRVADHSCGSPLTLINGDLHLENILFGNGSTRRTTLIDWQLGGAGLAAGDVSYLLIDSLSIDDRRTHESTLLSDYHQRLTRSGNIEYPFEQFIIDYRASIMRQVIRSLAVLGSYGDSQSRPDRLELSDRMFANFVAAIKDHNPVDAYAQLA